VFMWICKCKCNKIQIVNAAHLKRKGGVKSCGCLRRRMCNNKQGEN
jgi:hypothetical protein